MLAAGRGVRFGGVKQLAPVGPNGEAILDVLLERAASAGFMNAVVITAPAIEEQMRLHLAAHAPRLPFEIVLQHSPIGTADAVLVARHAISGPFAVVNADDLYPSGAFAMLAEHMSTHDEHAFVAFRVGPSLIGTQPVKRALLDFDDEGRLVALRETIITAGADGIRGHEWVSMNMWGFTQAMFDALARAVDEFVARETAGEILLPDVVSTLVGEGATVRVLRCEEPCIGITYAEDVDIVRRALA